MINIEIKYPILLIRSNDSNLYGTNKGLGLISKGGDGFYKKSINMIDKEGFMHELKEAKNGGNASFLDSLKSFQPMQQMNLSFIKNGRITLPELKNKLIKHIKAKPKHWLTLGTIEMIEEWINKKESISDLILMFK